MTQSAVREQQIRTLAQKPVEQVTMVLISANALLRAGIGHILAGTRFVVAERAPGVTTNLPALTGGEASLIR